MLLAVQCSQVLSNSHSKDCCISAVSEVVHFKMLGIILEELCRNACPWGTDSVPSIYITKYPLLSFS